eukprot:scaffold6676_cov113-Cylindrotheca_fusiformis.AAC.1
MKTKNSLFVQKPGLSVRNTNKEASSLSSKKSSGMSSFFSKKSKSSSTVTTASTMMTKDEDGFPLMVRSVAFDASSDANSTVVSQIASDASAISAGSANSNKETPTKQETVVFWKKGPRGMSHDECCGSEFIV